MSFQIAIKMVGEAAVVDFVKYLIGAKKIKFPPEGKMWEGAVGLRVRHKDGQISVELIKPPRQAARAGDFAAGTDFFENLFGENGFGK